MRACFDLWWYNFVVKFKVAEPVQVSYSRIKIESIKKIIPFLLKHITSAVSLISLIIIIAAAIWYRGYFLSKIKTAPKDISDVFYTAPTDKPNPTFAVPTPSNDNVLGASNNSVSDNSTENDTFSTPTPFPTFPPLPTFTLAPASTTTTSSTNNSGNSNCNTGSGVANAWYSDVYPNPPISASNGSVNLTVTIRDCNRDTASVNDQLTISLSSGDSNTQVNGNSLPYSVNAQNGQAGFSVSSQVSGTVVLVVHDSTAGFDITDVNNHNPSISFSATSSSGNSSCSTANGTPNSWYSDVYPPSSPVSTGVTTTFHVNIRDCGQNDVSSDNLTISQTSNDSSLTINGSSPPVNVQVQNGIATFTVSSQNAGTDALLVKDTTSGFTVTNTSNTNPSITFIGSSSDNSTPTPTSALSDTSPTPSPTPTTSPSTTPIPTGS